MGLRDGEIVAVGARADVRAALPDADEFDARGGLILPSFADAHVHLGIAAAESLGCELSDATGAEDCFRRIAAHATASTGAWVRGGGWRAEWFAGGTPTRQQLDALVPDRPALLQDSDRHGGWANSAALALAGIDAHTPDPADGVIVREADGSPAGTLREGAVNLVGRLVPPPSDAELGSGLVAAADELLARGITAWQEAALGAFAGIPDPTGGYLSALASGALRGHPTGAVWVPRDIDPGAVADAVAALVERAARTTAAGLPTRTAKIMLDGIVESQTAALAEPYPDGGRGLRYFPDEVVRAVVAGCNAAGLAVHLHAIGDAAVRQGLDAIEAAAPADRARVRNHMAHLQVVDPRDVPRFAELGVTANLQPVWACWGPVMRDLTRPLLGAARTDAQYPFGAFDRAGVDLAMGSDWPVSSLDPWPGVGVAVTRRAPGTPADTDDPPLGTGQELTLDRALRAYTRGSHALIGHDRGGLLRVGAAADVIVADRDPFAGPPAEIADTRIVATAVAGRIREVPVTSPR